jgi:2-polyprenyl-3-methyl-5-hydroxy-6-metoxy-1,4-benzoquinol methylase
MFSRNEATGGLSATPVTALRYAYRDNNKYENGGIFVSLLKEKERLLDIGCGTGSITIMLRDARSLSVIGIEPHPERAEYARRQGLDVITGEYDENIAGKIGRFDCVLFADVLEHLVDPKEMLVKVKSSLAPNGRVLASIPNIAHWSIRAQLLIGNFDYKATGIMDATHLRWFTRSSVRALFEDAGYEIEKLRGTAGGWMNLYNYTPLRWLTQDQKSYVLGQICRFAPGLFSAQHVILARPK